MAKRTPKTLYHYCSVNTFFSIMKNKSVWMSDVRKSNDSLEVKWINGHYRLFLLNTWIDYVKSVEEKDSVSLKDFEKFDAIKELSDFILKPELSKAWVFCLSELGDHLGQWRGYGDDGKGVAIGFNPKVFFALDNTFSKADESFNFCFRKVGYGEKAAKKFFDDILDEMAITPQTSPDEILLKLQQAALIARDVAPWFKNEGFKVEKEWRLIYKKEMAELLNGEQPTTPLPLEPFSDTLSIGNLGFTPKGDDLVSHVEFKMNSMDQIITEIVIGPKCKLTREDVILFLISCGIIKCKENCRIVISRSASSYR